MSCCLYAVPVHQGVKAALVSAASACQCLGHLAWGPDHSPHVTSQHLADHLARRLQFGESLVLILSIPYGHGPRENRVVGIILASLVTGANAVLPVGQLVVARELSSSLIRVPNIGS